MKKNIDHLFQQKLKDFQEVPEEKIWKAIEASLDKKKDKRRVIPIWWKLGGVAAILAIVLYITNPFKTTNNSTSNTITDIENTKVSPIIKKEDSSLKNTTKNKYELVEEEQKPAVLSPEKKKKTFIKVTKEKTTTIVHTTKTQKASQNKNNTAININTIAVQKEKQTNTGILQDNSNPIKKEKEKFSNTEEKQLAIDNTIINPIDSSNTNKKTIPKKSIFEEIENLNNEEVIVENTTKKWSLGASFAPVYFNGLGEGSPIDNSFSNNTKSGNVNLSYGLVVSYAINKKVSLRTGVHKVDYGYNTNDISFSPSINASTNTLPNVDYTITSKNIVVENALNNNREASLDAIDINTESVAFDGNMLQQFGYIEVPLEINYALLDRKLGVHIIGGLSSLFLIQNAISLESNELSTKIGKANNINTINFSTNIGLGVHYKFSPKIKLNIEPVFKYQLDTFSNTNSNFRPYSIGVYSGFSINF